MLVSRDLFVRFPRIARLIFSCSLQKQLCTRNGAAVSCEMRFADKHHRLIGCNIRILEKPCKSKMLRLRLLQTRANPCCSLRKTMNIYEFLSLHPQPPAAIPHWVSYLPITCLSSPVSGTDMSDEVMVSHDKSACLADEEIDFAA